MDDFDFIDDDEVTNDSSTSSVLSVEEDVDIDQKEMRSATSNIDRDKEDELVAIYKKTKDNKILSQLYEMREPTLNYWTQRYAYLVDNNKEDLFSDFRAVWYRCIEKYEYEARERIVKDKFGKPVLNKHGKKKSRLKRTSFNTFLYSGFIYWVRNIIKKKYSKKRTDIHGMPQSSIVVSMDENHGDDDASFTLHDVLSKKSLHSSSKMTTDEIIDLFADGDEEIKIALRLFAYNPSIKKLSTASRIRCGEIKLNPRERKLLKANNKSAISHLIRRIHKEKVRDNHFKLLSYNVIGDIAKWEVLTKNMRVFNKIVKRAKAHKISLQKIIG